MIKLILLASLISLPVFAQDIPETMPDETTEFVSSEPAPEEASAQVSEPEATIVDPVEETTAVIEPTAPVVEETNTPVVTTEETPVVSNPGPVARVEEPSTPVITTKISEDDEKFNPRESHWITTFGFEGMKYETDYNFAGAEKNFKPADIELWGGRIGFGGEIYLGAGLVTTTKIEGYYVGTLFSRVLNAGPEDEDEEFAYSKRTGQVYGIDASQSIGFLFDMRTKNPIMEEWTYLTVEPYVEVGVGRAKAYNRVNYDYNTGTTNEGYRKRIEDDLVSARIGGGINFTSTTGYFLYLKAFVNTFDITKRKTEEYTRPNLGVGTTVTDEPDNVKIDAITTYAIGGGYKF